MAAQRPENINEIILDTAEELLKVNSFSEVTLAKIAEKANISNPAPRDLSSATSG